MAFDKLFPEITQPQTTAPVPGAVGGGTSLADAWKGYQTLKTQNTFTDETGHPEDYWVGSNQDQVNAKYAIPDAGEYLRKQGWFAPQFTDMRKFQGWEEQFPTLTGGNMSLENVAGTGRYGTGGVSAYRMDPKYQDEAAFSGLINPYYSSGGTGIGKRFKQAVKSPAFWMMMAPVAGAVAAGAAGGGGAAGAEMGAAGAGSAGSFGAAPLFGEAAVAGAPVVGSSGALGSTALGSGALATEGLGAGSLWGGASGAMTAGAGATGAASLFGEGIGDLTNMAANEGVTTPMADTVNDGWLYDQMGTGNASVDDIVAAEGGYSSLPSQGMEQAGTGLKMPSITDLAKFGYSIYNNQQQNDRAMQLYKQAQQGMQASDPFAPGRATALADYQKMMADPMSYMSSPLAQMQVDQMNRAQRAKQAQLGDTWSINPTTGAIQGSGTGAVDFATQMQQNLAKQYEAALKSRAEMAGMNLFPNAQMLQQMGSAAGMQNTAGNTGAGLFGYGVDLAKQTGVIDWAKGQLGGLFGA